ncbi:glycosyltransferase [Dinghuibacter silviterrae]|uniref:Glycosyltransferase involved in cell wall biosynthesis n=1 Tax=Dinghuibacter silviterrae TaxID=1539049 RepID=A0A4R8DPM7_9BACT|nr:glycosyltransferase [Dinghuibacter silviterrae]TDW99246.1 glycosyltransferase involved in cell wall biosynthesis [Dinghuibacter silviterrae]
MKILFVSDTYYPHLNGVYYFVCRIGPLLQAKGHEVTVIAPSPTNKPTLATIDNLEVHGVPSLSTLFYPQFRVPNPYRLKQRVRRLLQTIQPDVIHIQDHFALGKAVVRVNRHIGIPIVGTNHFMPENLTALVRSRGMRILMERFLWTGFSRVFNQVAQVTTPTETGAALIRPRLRTAVSALSSGIDFDQFNHFGASSDIKAKYGIPEKPLLIFVGRIDPEKHIDEIIQAVALASQKTDLCFVIVGKGLKKAALEAQVRSEGLTDRIIFTGFVPDEDLPLLYKASHCFAIASIAELLSLATLQAMASGLPVIAVNAGALSEIVRDGDNGFLYASGDVPALADHINTLFNTPGLPERMGRRSIELARVHDIHKTVDAFEQLYAQYAR